MRRSDHDANRPSIKPLATQARQNAYTEQYRVQMDSSAKQYTVTPLIIFEDQGSLQRPETRRTVLKVYIRRFWMSIGIGSKRIERKFRHDWRRRESR